MKQHSRTGIAAFAISVSSMLFTVLFGDSDSFSGTSIPIISACLIPLVALITASMCACCTSAKKLFPVLTIVINVLWLAFLTFVWVVLLPSGPWM